MYQKRPRTECKSFTKIRTVSLNLPKGKKEIAVGTIFVNGTKVKDAYSGKTSVVENGKAIINSEFDIILLEKI